MADKASSMACSFLFYRIDTAVGRIGPLRLGIDVGGTFTDLVLVDPKTRSVAVLKVPTNRLDPAKALGDGLGRLLQEMGAEPSDIQVCGHGSTVATNTLVERTGSEVGLLVTAGFEDLLTLGRLGGTTTSRSLSGTVPSRVLVDPTKTRGVVERSSVLGAELIPIDIESVAEKSGELVESLGCQAIAVCLLHSCNDPEHEIAIGRLVGQLWPDMPVWLSHLTWPESREYERAIATSVNAYVGDKSRRYYRELGRVLRNSGVKPEPLIMQGNGGVCSIDAAAENPIATLQSGPSAGAIAAHRLGITLGYDQLIALDIGGTSSDVCVIDGALPVTNDAEIGGVPIIYPMIEVTSIGAGGGSIADVDPAGILRVGPDSAGAWPGPALFGHGGDVPTLTDAYWVSGMLLEEPTSSAITFDGRAAFRAIGELAHKLGTSLYHAARSVIDVGTAAMLAEIMRLLGSKGGDPGRFALICYGGAGPTHGFLLARELRIDTVIVPPAPGMLCAIGCALGDLRRDLIAPLRGGPTALQDVDVETLTKAVEQVNFDANRFFEEHSVEESDRSMVYEYAMRYRGQITTTLVSIDESELLDVEAVRERFLDRHRHQYGHSSTELTIEVDSLRAAATATIWQGSFDVLESMRPRIFDADKNVVAMDQLVAGVSGPLIGDVGGSTLYVPEAFTLRLARNGCLVGNRL